VKLEKIEYRAKVYLFQEFNLNGVTNMLNRLISEIFQAFIGYNFDDYGS